MHTHTVGHYTVIHAVSIVLLQTQPSGNDTHSCLACEVNSTIRDAEVVEVVNNTDACSPVGAYIKQY